jgi:hypothetical protein
VQALFDAQLARREEQLLVARAAACAGIGPQDLQADITRVKGELDAADAQEAADLQEALSRDDLSCTQAMADIKARFNAESAALANSLASERARQAVAMRDKVQRRQEARRLRALAAGANPASLEQDARVETAAVEEGIQCVNTAASVRGGTCTCTHPHCSPNFPTCVCRHVPPLTAAAAASAQTAVTCSVEVAATAHGSKVALAQHLATLQLSGVEEETRLAAKALHTRASALNDAMCALTSHLTSTVVTGDINADTAVRKYALTLQSRPLFHPQAAYCSSF